MKKPHSIAAIAVVGLLLFWSRLALATIPQCAITGTIQDPAAAALANGTITFNSQRTQIISGNTVAPRLVSTTTDSAGALASITLPQGIIVQITICNQSGTCYAPYSAVVPAQVTADFATLSQGANLTPNLNNFSPPTGPVDFNSQGLANLSYAGLVPTATQSLAACNASTKGRVQVVSDSTNTCSAGVTLTGGGSNICAVKCTGSAWVVLGDIAKLTGNSGTLDFTVSPPVLNKTNVNSVRYLTSYTACDGTNSDKAGIDTALAAGTGRVVIPGGLTCNYGTTAVPVTGTLTIPPDVTLAGDGERIGILSMHTTGGGACSSGTNGAILINDRASILENLRIQSDNASLDCLVNWSTASAIQDQMVNVRLSSSATAATTNPIGLYMYAAVSPFTRDLIFIDDGFRQDWIIDGQTNAGTFITTSLRPNSSNTGSVVFNRGKPQISIGPTGGPAQGNTFIGTTCEIGPNCFEVDNAVGTTFIGGWGSDVSPSNVLGYWTPATTVAQNNWVLQSSTVTGDCHSNTTIDNLSGALYVNQPVTIPCGVANALVSTYVAAVASATSVTVNTPMSVTTATNTIYYMNYQATGCWRAQTAGTTGATQPGWPGTPTAGSTTQLDNNVSWISGGPCAWYYLNSSNVAGTTIIGGYWQNLVAGVVNNGALNTRIMGGQWIQGQYGFFGLGGGQFDLASVRVSGSQAGVVVRGTGDIYRLGPVTYSGLTNIFDLGGSADGDVLAQNTSDVSGPDITRWKISARNNTLSVNKDTFPGDVIVAGASRALQLGSGGTRALKLKEYTPTLSPAIVNANTCAGQDVPVTGVTTADHIVECLKPTEQAGLSSPVCRVKSANTVTMNFCNTTGAGITPTAAEVYSITAVTF